MELMETLRPGLPPGTLLTEPAAMAPYLLDWRKLYQGRALCVARPRETGEVARIVAAAAAAGVAIVPQGGNTGLTGGSVPLETGDSILLSLDADEYASARSIRPTTPSRSRPAASCRTCRRPRDAADRLFPLSLGRRGHLPDRRQYLDQRRRHRGAALRQ